MSQQFPDRMVSAPVTSGHQTAQPVQLPKKMAFRIEIPGPDGTMLLVLREQDGYLVVEGDESRWDEGAKRFLYAMMQWSGIVGLRWKDEVKAAVEGQQQ